MAENLSSESLSKELIPVEIIDPGSSIVPVRQDIDWTQHDAESAEAQAVLERLGVVPAFTEVKDNYWFGEGTIGEDAQHAGRGIELISDPLSILFAPELDNPWRIKAIYKTPGRVSLSTFVHKESAQKQGKVYFGVSGLYGTDDPDTNLSLLDAAEKYDPVRAFQLIAHPQDREITKLTGFLPDQEGDQVIVERDFTHGLQIRIRLGEIDTPDLGQRFTDALEQIMAIQKQLQSFPFQVRTKEEALLAELPEVVRRKLLETGIYLGIDREKGGNPKQDNPLMYWMDQELKKRSLLKRGPIDWQERRELWRIRASQMLHKKKLH